MRGDHSDEHCGFLTILDNVLTVGRSAGGKKQASQYQPQSGGLPVGAGGGTKMAWRRTSPRHSCSSWSAAKNTSTSPSPTLKKLKINAPISIIVLILLRFSRN